jgi:hypothetical protein
VGVVEPEEPDFFDDGPVVEVVEVVDDPDEDDDPDGDDDPADVLDFWPVVVVVVGFGRVVVVVVEDRVVVVVVDDFDVVAFDPDVFELVVVVVDLAVDFDGAGVDESLAGARGFGGVPRDDSVVDVVAAAGTLGSSLAGDSSRAWVGPPAAAGGAVAGGGMRSSRRAYCMIRAKTGADTWPP